MKKGLSEIVCVIDKSGSMETIKTDAIGGYNTFLQEQKEVPGEALWTLILFDTEYNVVYDGKNIQDVKPLTEKTYNPGGWTALLDAMGRAIDTVGSRLEKTKEEDRPEKVIVVILTDGEENSSREYKHSQIKNLINHQKEKYNWEFIFLGANQDAIKTGSSYGITLNQGWQASGTGVRDVYCSVSSNVRSLRTS